MLYLGQESGKLVGERGSGAKDDGQELNHQLLLNRLLLHVFAVELEAKPLITFKS